MPWGPKQTVLVPVDFSPESLAAVSTALEIAATPGGVHIIHVLSELSPAEPILMWEEYESAKRKEAALEMLAKSLAEAGLPDLKRHVFIGDPGQEIAAFAERLHADLIVIPSHGRTGIRRLLIGSVAERVIRLAQCPVLVMRQ